MSSGNILPSYIQDLPPASASGSSSVDNYNIYHAASQVTSVTPSIAASWATSATPSIAEQPDKMRAVPGPKRIEYDEVCYAIRNTRDVAITNLSSVTE